MQQQTETTFEENKQIPLFVAFCPVAFCAGFIKSWSTGNRTVGNNGITCYIV